MRRHPAVSLRGALQILGHHDRPWLDRLNSTLGGVVLASGTVPAAAAVSAVWGWVDQKNEAVSLVRKGLDSVSARLLRTDGLERHELVVAAHTTIVISSFFEVLRLKLGDLYDEAAFSDREKVLIASRDDSPLHDSLVRQLYRAPIPIPSAAFGFEENTGNLLAWSRSALTGVHAFMKGLDLSRTGFGDWSDLADLVVSRYRSNYLALSATVSEFEVWAGRVEHAATRSAMSRLESALSTTVSATPSRDLRAVIRDINRSVLRRPVIDANTDGYGIDAIFPALEDIFIAPNYRLATAGGDANLASESWWSSRAPKADLDLLFARHFSTPGSTDLPLLLLGHPGSGKSLITQMIAARLPDDAYTVVPVLLRRVDANASIPYQIQQALDQSTHGRVSWPELADQSADVIRVVLLDGLDELLQATTHDRADFLYQIVEFQRVEAALGRPAAVVVTSRTLVVDRVAVPNGTPAVKLEEFDEKQIRQWVRVWNETNQGRPVRPMSAATALSYRELARQPLLLLMLTLYYADPQVAADEELSTARLYERLFATFAQREVTKKAGRVLRGNDQRAAVEQQLRRLSVAALGMFNRGRQDITEADLGADLALLEGEQPTGGRVLAEFFFVHSPEAVADGVYRSYEFLHATFGEYLVAARVVDVLRDTAEGAFNRRNYHEPDDDLLFALLSHQPLAVQHPVLSFIGERLVALVEIEREWIVKTLQVLAQGYRKRRPSRSFGDYRPQPPDTLRALAAYTANLVLLRTEIGDGDVPLTDLWPDDPLAQWRATITLWQAGLDSPSYHTVLAAVDLVDGSLVASRNTVDAVTDAMELHHARLMHDLPLLSRLRTGHAVYDRLSALASVNSPEAIATAWVIDVSRWLSAESESSAEATPQFLLPSDLPDLDDRTRKELTAAGVALLHKKLGNWDTNLVRIYLHWLLALAGPDRPELLGLVIRGLDRSYEERIH